MRKSTYIKSLQNEDNTAIFKKSSGIGHPSQPNYLRLYSGDNQGIKGYFGGGDRRPPTKFTTPNLGAQLKSANDTLITYSEDLPYAGFDGDAYELYVRRHNPATNWMGNGLNQTDSMTNQPFSSFQSSPYSKLPQVCYVIPNLHHDMHTKDSTGNKIKVGDDWLKKYLGDYISWAQTHNSIFILTFDEGSRLSFTNRITTIFIGEHVRRNFYSDKINHYNVLRTIEDMFHLPYAGHAADVKPITDCWQ